MLRVAQKYLNEVQVKKHLGKKQQQKNSNDQQKNLHKTILGHLYGAIKTKVATHLSHI